jgi:membrane-associated phospholipid phosphatase
VQLVATDLVRVVASPERIANLMAILLLFPAYAQSFSVFKSLVPVFQPFVWDADFAAWDRLVHFGHDPWQLLQPLFGYPIVSSILNVLYHCWLFVMYGVIFSLAAATRNPVLRMRGLLSLMLAWPIFGNFAATLLSSAGPVYFARVTGLPDPFVPLLDYLRTAAAQVYLPALDVQEMLWQSYIHNNSFLGSGISAMPSLHVATSFLFAVIGFRYRRWLGWLLGAFFLCILLSSVHLGWHYAIDGYAGIVCAWSMWRAIGWLLDRAAVRRLLALPPETAPDAG